ncbi:HTH-type transcriptional activator TipA [Corynebacterium faecale]|uniref:MerR family transcriptional regulator n=1 Tax=Corynebacterium faecale TaxID=1758466 RepID=UPI0025B38147|nr:MerR family transcriptional regulator [Corynebacterium faecale]WJY93094.1 HTH-type transcriptional activator TipA [Corynebacterium faecale]
MADYTIGEAAEILHVTTRTLRHWDSIGLLSPTWRTRADHRLYTDDDLETALQILVYREAGVPLKEIVELLAQPATAVERLRRQREILVERIGQLHRMVRAVDEILEEEDMSDQKMTTEEKIKLFGGDWQDEAEQRWGDTPEWEQSQQREAKMTKDDWYEVKEAHDRFVDKLVDAATRGVEPGSEPASLLVAEHLASVDRFYDVSRSKQVLLARMYVSDERFNETYRGQAAYLLSLVEAQAEQEGLDLSEISWA